MLNYGLFADTDDNTELISNSKRITSLNESPVSKLRSDLEIKKINIIEKQKKIKHQPINNYSVNTNNNVDIIQLNNKIITQALTNILSTYTPKSRF
jgi:hypothetical protein